MLRSMLARLAAPAAALALLAGAAPQLTAPAHADMLWCWDDPIVAVQGNLLDIRVEQPLLNLLTMRSTTLTVVIPNNTRGSVVLNDVSVFPMKTTISATGPAWKGSGPIPVTIKTTVTSFGTYPVQVVGQPLLNLTNLLGGPSSASGKSNATTTLNMTLGK